ncbi:MAG: leucine-rich repeat domain-containing protein, partial [Oscillospiraceae bacterium]|nr:leucine-rich repeat domain-containing protein [Oscillospiraceae bacterium]
MNPIFRMLCASVTAAAVLVTAVPVAPVLALEAPTEAAVQSDTMQSALPEPSVAGAVLAADDGIVTGTWGNEITWTLHTDTGALVLSGTGKMVSMNDNPFDAYQDSITSVVIGEGITSVCAYAFQRYKALTSVSLPSTLTEIGNEAFSGCGITALDLPDSLAMMKFGAFQGCQDLAEVHLPASLTEIPDDAFYGCKSLSSIVIPDTVTRIGDTAFGYTGLTAVSIPDSVKSIDEQAFIGCPELRSAELGEGVQSLGARAFQETALESVTLPSTLTEVGERAFWGTPYLEAITNSASAGLIILENGILYEYVGDAEEVVIPDGVAVIAVGVFRGSAIKAVTLPDSLTVIDKEAFKDCTALETVSNLDGVREVGVSAFLNTPFIDRYPEDMIIFGEVLYLYKGQDTDVTIPDGVVTIAPEAFAFRFNLEHVTLPSTLTSIGELAFLGCNALTGLYVPEQVTEFGSRAIGYYCANGISGTYYKLDAMVLYGMEGSAVQRYAEENSVSFAPLPVTSADHSCGENVTWAFDDATGKLTISGTGDMSDFISGDTLYLSDDAVKSPFYRYRSRITSVEIEEGITSVGDFAFEKCSRIVSVSLPSTLTRIGSHAFRYCGSLNELGLPDGLENIYPNAFEGCGMQHLTLPVSLLYTGENAFANCTALTDVTVPAGC